MQININEIEYCKLLVQYEADPDKVSKKRNEVINRFKSYRVPGFRPGKATTDAIRLHYSKEIYETLQKELTDDAFHDVIFEKNIKPFGQPNINSIQLESSKFICEFSIHKQPDFELGIYNDFDIPKFSGYLSEEELVQRMLQELRTKHGTMIAYENNDFVQMNDSVIADYAAFLDDGTPVQSLTATGQILNIGKINIPNFSESLLGMKPSETREFVLHVPENHATDCAGKDIKFMVKLISGSKVDPAPLDDSLAKQVGLETFELLTQNAHSTASARIKELEKNHHLDQIARRLLVNHDFKIPQWIITAEAQVAAKNSKQEWDSMLDVEKEKLIQQSEDNIKLSLILAKIREKEPEAQLTDEEVFETAKTNLSNYSQEPDKVMAEIFKSGNMPMFFNRIRDEYTLNFIEKRCTFIE
jgi:trigger factor